MFFATVTKTHKCGPLFIRHFEGFVKVCNFNKIAADKSVGIIYQHLPPQSYLLFFFLFLQQKAQLTTSVVLWLGSSFQPLKCCRHFGST